MYKIFHRKKVNRIEIIVLLMILVLTGCGSKSSPMPSSDGSYQAGSKYEDSAKESDLQSAQGDEKEHTIGGEDLVAVTLEGGSGRASIESPAKVIWNDEGGVIQIRWSSSHYDYMIVDDVTYLPVSIDGGSLFEVPINEKTASLEVIADTTAMGTPHEIAYTIRFAWEDTVFSGVAVDGDSGMEMSNEIPEPPMMLGSDRIEKTGQETVRYAKQFRIDLYEKYKLISIAGNDHRFLLIPEGSPVPDGLSEDIFALQMPVDRIYLAASSGMQMFERCGAIDHIGFCSLEADEWYEDSVRSSMEQGEIRYAGKYSAPDYEQIRAGGCELTIENMMIFHAPEIKEQLELLGIPVLIDRSSYEDSPQGRMEWIRLYGTLTDHLDVADRIFAEQIDRIDSVITNRAASETDAGPTVIFFSIDSGGNAVVRGDSDYINSMIRMAGGTVPDYGHSKEETDKDAGGGSGKSTYVIQMEAFYTVAAKADYLIYNGTIEGEIESLQELGEKSPLLMNCDACQNQRVYACSGNLYQSSMELGDFVADLRNMMDQKQEFCFLKPLN